MLIVAAWLKIEAPWIAGDALAWTGLEWRWRYAIVLVGSWVETGIGSAIVLSRHHVATMFGIVTIGVLVVLHVVTIGVARDCGCFGNLAVANWSIAIGAACAMLMLFVSDRVRNAPVLTFRAKLGKCAVGGAVACTTVWLSLAQQAGWVDGVAELRLALRELPAGVKEARCLIGAWSCVECKTALNIARGKVEKADAAVALVVRRGDAVDDSERYTYPWVYEIRLDETVWWALRRGSERLWVRITGLTGSDAVKER